MARLFEACVESSSSYAGTEAVLGGDRGIHGSKIKAVNNRDKNFTDRKLKARMQQLEESIARDLTELDRADREPALVTEARSSILRRRSRR